MKWWAVVQLVFGLAAFGFMLAGWRGLRRRDAAIAYLREIAAMHTSLIVDGRIVMEVDGYGAHAIARFGHDHNGRTAVRGVSVQLEFTRRLDVLGGSSVRKSGEL